MSAISYLPNAFSSQQAILCAECGAVIEPNGANLCIGCLRNSVDITATIPKEATLTFCRGCDRWFAPPGSWMGADLESRELLSICLKKIAKPLTSVRLISASFLWTEPHSRRIKVTLTLQKEVLASTVLQQTMVITYVVHGAQCPQCTRLAAKNTWRACVQVRQKVNHKRTFLFLEQLILKHNAHKDTISIDEKKDGLDFFYSERNHAIKMVDFLGSVVPIRSKSSERILSSDTHTNTANFKFTYSVEIVPVCKDDLVCLEKKLARGWGDINPLTLCTRVGNSIHLMDPTTLQYTDVTSATYWRAPFDSLATVTDLVEFMVLDIEPSGPVRGKWVLADAQVARVTGNGFGTNEDMDDGMGGGDGVYHTRTHLGAVLQPGDTVLGFHLTNANFNSSAFEALNQDRIPDVILVKKTYPNRRKKSKPRNWKLRSIAKEADGEENINGGVGRGALGRRGGVDQQKVEKDYELFLRDLEEDPELRSAINLYKVDKNLSPEENARRKKQHDAMQIDEDDEDEEGEKKDGEEGAEGDEDMEEEEEDFPDVQLDELLDHFEDMDIKDGPGQMIQEDDDEL